MIPYLYENGRVPIEEVASRFNLTEEEVVSAIDRITTLGDALLEPHQLIDAYIEDRYVGMDIEPAVKRPIRLTAKQAFALLVGADFLRIEGLTISPALAQAVEKVRRATSSAELDRLEELEPPNPRPPETTTRASSSLMPLASSSTLWTIRVRTWEASNSTGKDTTCPWRDESASSGS